MRQLPLPWAIGLTSGGGEQPWMDLAGVPRNGKGGMTRKIHEYTHQYSLPREGVNMFRENKWNLYIWDPSRDRNTRGKRMMRLKYQDRSTATVKQVAAEFLPCLGVFVTLRVSQLAP